VSGKVNSAAKLYLVIESVYVAGKKLEIKTACSYATASARVCSELATALCGPPSNRRKWIPLKLALTIDNLYVSLESALSYWGLSTQSSVALTCVTTGKLKEYRTPEFRITFRTISKRLFWGFIEKQTRYSKYAIAEPQRRPCSIGSTFVYKRVSHAASMRSN
jgi:hypothetical protein